jgi:20S proteasome alpha/beta subunit
VALPLFPPESDPGPDFVGLLRMTSGQPEAPARTLDPLTAAPAVQAPHGTTVVALRYADGVVMAGDRRATAGNIIAHRPWRRSSRPTASPPWPLPARPAWRLRWSASSRSSSSTTRRSRAPRSRSRARPTSWPRWCASTCPWPCRASPSCRSSPATTRPAASGRIFSYDATGGHYEDTDFQATGSGGRDARSTIKLGWREGLARDEAVDLAIQSLYEAADEDSATGGPDLVRGIYPLIAVVDAAGLPLVPEDEVAERFGALIARRQAERASMSMPYYVAPEQVMKDRAEYAQKGIARGRSLVATTYDVGIAIVAENPSRSLHKISEIYDRIAFGGVGKYNEYDQLRVAGVRHADTKGYAYSREDVDARSLANLYAQYLGNVFTHEMKPLEVEILVAELGETPEAPAVPHRLRGHDHRRGPFRRAGRRRRDHHRARRRSLAGRVGPGQRPQGAPRRPWPARTGPWGPVTSKWPS